MATVPLSGTNIRFLSNIPFSNDYKNTRWFDSVSEQTQYFLNKTVVHNMLEANFQRIEGKHFISVNKSIDELWGTNYVMFQNASYNAKWFYGFVTKLEYKQRNTTYVHFEIDVLQTWKFDMNFKPSFVIREHTKLWNDDGSPVVNTVDEGLDYGSQYVTKSVEKYRPFNDLFFLVIVAKAWVHTRNAVSNEIVPTLNGVPQPLTYYVHPFKMDGSVVNVNVGGSNINASSILNIIKACSTHDDAVNNIVSMYVTDFIGANAFYDEEINTVNFSGANYSGATMSYHDVENNTDENVSTVYVEIQPTYASVDKTFTDKYSGYEPVTESKLLMYPYTVLVLDDLKGNRTTFKNEFIYNPDIKISVRGSLGTSNKTVYSILDYMKDSGLDYTESLFSSMEYSLINNNPSDIPIVTVFLSAYIQGNKNSLENQKETIIFNGAMNAINNSVGGVASGIEGNSVGVMSSIGQVAQGAGNTVLQLQALEAKKSDINNTPPQLAKMGNNTNFDYGNDIAGVYIIKKQITAEYRNKLTDFFNMYGYKLNEVKIPNFHTRQYWNYVQTASCTITGNFNNEDLIGLKSVFDNGITFWHTDDVGNYSLPNGVI